MKNFQRPFFFVKMIIEDIQDYVQNKLHSGTNVIYADKTAPVRIKHSKIGTKIITKMADGWLETENEVRRIDDVVVCGSHGEEYILNAEEFARRYEPSSNSLDSRQPKPIKQKFICIDEDITFYAPWKAVMYMRKGDVLNITDTQNIYGITAAILVTDYTVSRAFPAVEE